MQQLRSKAKLYVHNRNGIFNFKSKGYITTWFVFSVVVAASLHWAGFVLLRELWVTEDQRNPFTLQFTYVHHNPRVEGDFSWQFIKFLSIFVKPVTNSKYVFHVQVEGNQNQSYFKCLLKCKSKIYLLFAITNKQWNKTTLIQKNMYFLLDFCYKKSESIF